MELGHWVAGSMGHLGHLFSLGHWVPLVIIMTQCATRFFYFKAPFCSLPYVCRVLLILTRAPHRRTVPTVLVHGKRELILALSL